MSLIEKKNNWKHAIRLFIGRIYCRKMKLKLFMFISLEDSMLDEKRQTFSSQIMPNTHEVDYVSHAMMCWIAFGAKMTFYSAHISFYAKTTITLLNIQIRISWKRQPRNNKNGGH